MCAKDVQSEEASEEPADEPTEMDVELQSIVEENDAAQESSSLNLQMLQAKIEELEAKNEMLSRKVELSRFCFSRFSHDNEMINFYTGFTKFAIFEAFFNYIQPTADKMTRLYYIPVEGATPRASSQRSLPLIDEFFLFCCRIRLGLLEDDLSVRFGISTATVSRLIISWANFLYFVLGAIPIWPTREMVNLHMPPAFKALYPKTRCILDCTEVFTERPSSLVLNSQMYSNYKSHCTLKGLIGIAPNGAITFVSKLYTGSISDVAIVKDSGFLNLVQAQDSIMADKGFTIRKMLEEVGATLNIPSFLTGKVQFSPEEITMNQQIATVRVHVERAIRRIKVYRIFSSPLPLSLMGSCNQLWTVVCLLTNFRGALIKDKVPETS